MKGVQGFYSKQDLELLEANAPNNEICKRAVIVGGGLIGIELAEMLRSRDIPVTFLVRETSFWNGVLPKEESQMINEHIQEHHIDLKLDTNLKEIISDEKGWAKAVVTDKGENIPCTVVGLTAGVTPNIDFLKGSGIELGIGVKVNNFLETNITDVYAIGDCAEQHEAIGSRRPVEAVWYTGRMMGEALAQTICGNKRMVGYLVRNPKRTRNNIFIGGIPKKRYVSPSPSTKRQNSFWGSILLVFDCVTKFWTDGLQRKETWIM